MKEQMILRGQESMLSSNSMSFSECRKGRQFVICRKVTVISESKDLTSMTATSLFGKLREHDLEMNRLVVQEREDKHSKGIALKAAN